MVNGGPGGASEHPRTWHAATIMGLGGAVFEAMHFGGGRILNPLLSTYRIPSVSDNPPIEVVLIDRQDCPSAGAGETPMIAVAPALANAVLSVPAAV
jgi:nicotinate dehydrogenase subunit B